MQKLLFQQICQDVLNFFLLNTLIIIIIIIIIIKPRLMRHMSVTKEDESQAWGHVIVYG